MMSDRIRINLLRNHWLRSLRQRTVASQIASLGETRTLEKQMRPRPAPAETRIRVGIVGAGYHARQAHMPILEGLASQYEVVYAVTRRDNVKCCGWRSFVHDVTVAAEESVSR